jgi:hypothetical protein
MKKLTGLRQFVAGTLMLCGVAGAAQEMKTVRASGAPGLAEMERACGVTEAPCRIVVSTAQVITLSRPHTIPAGIVLRFEPGGEWTVNGATLTVGSGVVEAPESGQIFAGNGAIEGLSVVRPEWFVPAETTEYPQAALAAAYRATRLWGTILLSVTAYDSPFYSPTGCDAAMTPYATPRKIVGVGRPALDDGQRPQALVGGTVIRGEICGSAPLAAEHLGVDTGPKVVESLYGGSKSDGIFLFQHGRFNPKQGTNLTDVAVLTNDSQTEHSVLVEGEEGAVIAGLWIWTLGGTHGLVLKSAHSLVSDFHCKGASSDCLLVKSDYRTAANGRAEDDQLDGITISDLAKPGDTGGIVLDATWDDVSRISFKNVQEDGLSFGFHGEGSWLYKLKGLTITYWTAQAMTGPCTEFKHSGAVQIVQAQCDDSLYRAEAQSAPQQSWWRRSAAELKPELRILWTTVATWSSVLWHRL